MTPAPFLGPLSVVAKPATLVAVPSSKLAARAYAAERMLLRRVINMSPIAPNRRRRSSSLHPLDQRCQVTAANTITVGTLSARAVGRGVKETRDAKRREVSPVAVHLVSQTTKCVNTPRSAQECTQGSGKGRRLPTGLLLLSRNFKGTPSEVPGEQTLRLAALASRRHQCPVRCTNSEGR